MDEGKNPNPRIFTISEAAELSEEIRDLIDALKEEKQRSCGMVRITDNTNRDSSRWERTIQLISRMKFLAIALEHGSVAFTEADMHAASILYNDTVWEMFQISNEKSYHAKMDHQ